MSSIFLSHNSKDKPWVRNLADRLTSDGVVVWIDEAELNIGDSLIEKIAEGIQEMRFVAAVISKNSISSTWVQKELNLAMSKEIKGRQVTVLPLLIESCTLPPSLTDKLYADFRSPDNFEREYSKLLRAIGVQAASQNTQTKEVEEAGTAAQKQEQESLNLRIVGVVKERTRQDPNYSGLQDYYFELSAMPPPEWDLFFDKSRSFPRHSMWREAWIEGDCVVVKCALDEIERYHLRDLKEDVAKANADYMKALRMHEEQERQKRELARKQKEERDGKLDRLDFDLE